MKYFAVSLILGILGLCTWGYLAKPVSGGPPPLKVDRSAPLLLESSKEKSEEDEILADNSSCYVCHTNYEEEPLVHTHAIEDVGCMDCHGKSLAHRDDEDNITPPDTMYAAEDIDKACKKCHDIHDAPARKVIARWQKRCPKKTDPETLVCTDCHGKHRLAFRTVWWDKKTRALIIRDKERTKKAVDYTKPVEKTSK